MPTIIAIELDGDVTHHAHGSGSGLSDYATLCGLALDGDQDSGSLMKNTKKKIDCAACKGIWLISKEYLLKDFE